VPITLATTGSFLCEHPVKSKDVVKRVSSSVERTTAIGKKPMKNNYAVYIENNTNIHAN